MKIKYPTWRVNGTPTPEEYEAGKRVLTSEIKLGRK
jgi:hypothetical protein